MYYYYYYYYCDCVNNKMLEYDWLIVNSPYLRLTWLFQVQTVQFDLSDYKYLCSDFQIVK